MAKNLKNQAGRVVALDSICNGFSTPCQSSKVKAHIPNGGLSRTPMTPCQRKMCLHGVCLTHAVCTNHVANAHSLRTFLRKFYDTSKKFTTLHDNVRRDLLSPIIKATPHGKECVGTSGAQATENRTWEGSKDTQRGTKGSAQDPKRKHALMPRAPSGKRTFSLLQLLNPNKGHRRECCLFTNLLRGGTCVESTVCTTATHPGTSKEGNEGHPGGSVGGQQHAIGVRYTIGVAMTNVSRWLQYAEQW